MKKIIAIISLFIACLMLLGASSGCAVKNEKKTILCTVFPIYDWARQVVGDSDTFEVKLLVSDGADLHSFQPTAKDAINIRTADIIIRVGGLDDSFVGDLVDAGEGIDLRLIEAEGVNLRHMAHSSEHTEDDGHDHAADEHIWLSLRNAAACVSAISEALCAADPENAIAYRLRAEEYIKELSALDEKYENAVAVSDTPRVIFADRFPFVYLTADYGIEYEAAFEGCSTEAEASFDTVIRLSRQLDTWQSGCLLVTETSDLKLYETVRDLDPSRKPELIVLDSMQSGKSSDIESGVTYIKIMEKNLSALSHALSFKEKK